MASNTVAPEAIVQTAEPLCAKIALTEPAISIGLFQYALFGLRFKTEYSGTEKFSDTAFRTEDRRQCSSPQIGNRGACCKAVILRVKLPVDLNTIFPIRP